MATRKRPSKTLTKDAMGKEIKTVALLGAGLVIGTMGGKMLDKMLKVDPTDTRINLKKFVSPLVILGAGTIGSIKLSEENVKTLAKGVAISGILSAAKVILPKNLLSGMEGFDGLGNPQYDAYGEPIGTLQNVPVYYEPETVGNTDETLLLGSSDLDLPELRAAPINSVDDETVGNADEPTISSFGTRTSESLSDIGEVTAYQEIL